MPDVPAHAPSPHPSDQSPTIPAGYLPPLTIKDLPAPPRALAKIIGPTAVLTATALGSGELVMWPYLTSVYSLGMIWAAVLGMLTQYFMNMEIERWTLATGESVYAGLSRMSRSIPPILLACTIIPFAWPGWSAGVGYLMAHLLQVDSTTGFSIAAVLLAGLVLTLGPVVYNTLERLQMGIILLAVPGVLLLIVLMATPEDFVALAHGVVNVGYIPDGFYDWQVFAGALAFAGLGGITNLVQSMYINDKGYGMGAHTPPLYGIITGKHETGYVPGCTFPINDVSLDRWRRWWRTAHWEHFVTFFVIGCGTLLMLTMLAHRTITVPGYGVSNDLSFLLIQAEELARHFGPWIAVFFLIMGLFFLFSSAIGIIDAVGRSVAELIAVNYTRTSRRWTRQTCYFVTIWTLIGIGVVIFSLGITEPFWLLVTSASLNAVVMFVYNLLIFHMNRTRLPRPLRPNRVRSVAMIWAIGFFGFASGMMIYQWLT